MPRIDIDALPVRIGSGYPLPFRLRSPAREKRALGDVEGLSAFGVNLTRLPPGEWSSQRHWHSAEDEFVWVLSGELALIADTGEERLGPGECAAFKAGAPDGHHFVNRGKVDAIYLEVGARRTDDKVTYPDVDLAYSRDGYTHEDGTPYPAG